MAAPGRKFSFGRFITNAFPNFANDDKNDVNLSPQQADLLLTSQLGSPFPRYLNETAFSAAKITDSESISKKVYNALVKHNIILPVPEASSSGAGGETLTVNTGGITKDFANWMSMISVHAQRKLVGLLFFWEEECMRWKLLDQEEREILSALEANKGNADLQCALEAVRMKMKLLPSKRGEETANVGPGAVHELPSYS